MKPLLLLSVVFATMALSATQPSNSTSFFGCPPNGVAQFAVPGSCTSYHFCFAGSHAVRECGDGLHFASWMGLCAFPEDAACSRDLCPPTNDINNIVTVPSETNCDEYSMCIDGNLERFRCAWGVHWNQATQTCERPEIAQCEVNKFNI